MDNKFQHDFFGDLQREREARKKRFLSRYSKHRFLPHLRVPTEHVVVTVIAVLVLVIVAYALGIERGKRISLEETRKSEPSDTQVYINEEVTPITQAPEISAEKPSEEAAGPAYMIQLASFRDLSTAQDETEKLKKEGFNAMLEKSGSWYRIYTEGYRSRAEAEQAKKELDKYYKDCYIRRAK
jgi:hypothetical protein